MPSGEKEFEATITGHVQGVNFRNFVHKHAHDLGVTGYVRNYDDGSVEVVAQGDPEQLGALSEQLWKGPYFARVDDVDIRWHDMLQDTFTDFTIDRS